jgi:hypothetical protein
MNSSHKSLVVSRSFWAFWVAVLFVFGTSFFFYPKWNKSGNEATISWDVAGYYHYLPAFLIYKDALQQRFSEQIQHKYQPASNFYSAYQDTASGNWVMKYSAGQALMFAPAFLAAHQLAQPLGFEADGYSLPYQFAIQLWSVLVGLLGLWVLRGVLLRLHFSDNTVALTILLYALGTNYLNYVAIDGAMTHGYLFTVYALLMAATMRFYERPTAGRSVAIGALVGLAILTRPTELLAAVVPIFWGVPSWRNLTESRIPFLVKKRMLLLFALIATVAVGSVQLFYWHYATGHWIVYSYGEQSFSWLQPHILAGFFSYRKGWLVYTPLMWLSMIGFFPLSRRHKNLFLTTLLFFILFSYVTFAWDIWWYASSVSQRPMVQALPMLALPFAAGIDYLLHKNNVTRIAFIIFVIATSYINLFWTYQAHGGGNFDGDAMTKAYFWRVIGRYKVPPESKKLLDNRYDFLGECRDVKPIFSHDFEQDTNVNIEIAQAINGKKSLFVDNNHATTPFYPLPITAQTLQTHRWLRASATFRSNEKELDTWQMTQFKVVFFRDNKEWKEFMIRPARFLEANEIKTYYLDAKIPSPPFDRVCITFENTHGGKKMIIDDLRVTLFNE